MILPSAGREYLLTITFWQKRTMQILDVPRLGFFSMPAIPASWDVETSYEASLAKSSIDEKIASFCSVDVSCPNLLVLR